MFGNNNKVASCQSAPYYLKFIRVQENKYSKYKILRLTFILFLFQCLFYVSSKFNAISHEILYRYYDSFPSNFAFYFLAIRKLSGDLKTKVKPGVTKELSNKSLSGQNESNPVLRLATRAGQMALSFPL